MPCVVSRRVAADTYFEAARRLSRGRIVWSGRDNLIGIRAIGFKGPKSVGKMVFKDVLRVPWILGHLSPIIVHFCACVIE